MNRTSTPRRASGSRPAIPEGVFCAGVAPHEIGGEPPPDHRRLLRGSSTRKMSSSPKRPTKVRPRRGSSPILAHAAVSAGEGRPVHDGVPQGIDGPKRRGESRHADRLLVVGEQLERGRDEHEGAIDQAFPVSGRPQHRPRRVARVVRGQCGHREVAGLLRDPAVCRRDGRAPLPGDRERQAPRASRSAGRWWRPPRGPGGEPVEQRPSATLATSASGSTKTSTQRPGARKAAAPGT